LGKKGLRKPRVIQSTQSGPRRLPSGATWSATNWRYSGLSPVPRLGWFSRSPCQRFFFSEGLGVLTFSSALAITGYNSDAGIAVRSIS
jgi:hypothetical protein